MSRETQIRGGHTPRYENLERDYERDLGKDRDWSRNDRRTESPFAISRRQSSGRAKRGIKRRSISR